MILIVGPVLIVGAVLMLVAPRVFGLLARAAVLLAILCALYVVDGQREHPLLPHGQPKSAEVR